MIGSMLVTMAVACVVKVVDFVVIVPPVMDAPVDWLISTSIR